VCGDTADQIWWQVGMSDSLSLGVAGR
jgi:hypothetical protein